MAKRFEDNYCLQEKGSTFMDEIKLRDANTQRFNFLSDEISIWSGVANDDGTITVTRLGEKILTKTIKAQHVDDAMFHTATVVPYQFNGTGLFLGYKGKTKIDFIPISAACKLSILNRGKFSLTGELNDGSLGICPMALARVIEDSIKKFSKKIKVIVVHGKVIGIMSDRYCPIPQEELTNMVYRVLCNRYPNSVIEGGIITNRITTVNFDLKHQIAERGIDYEILMSLYNSDNGYSGVRLVHECRQVGKNYVYPFYDDDWHSDHIAVTMQDIEQGADTMFLKLRNNVALLANAQERLLKHPYIYADAVIGQLNKMSAHKGGAKITKAMTKDILQTIDTFVSQGIQKEFTVMDVADVMIQTIPNGSSDTTENALMKTIMRIIHINHDEYDKI